MLSDLEVVAMERCWWVFPLEMLLPFLHLPEMKYLPAEVVPLACEGGGIRTTTGFGLLRVELSDPWPGISSITRDRRFLTSMVMLPSPSNLGAGLMGDGYHSGGDLADRQHLLLWLICQGWQNVNLQVDGLACSKTYAIGQWLW